MSETICPPLPPKTYGKPIRHLASVYGISFSCTCLWQVPIHCLPHLSSTIGNPTCTTFLQPFINTSSLPVSICVFTKGTKKNWFFSFVSDFFCIFVSDLKLMNNVTERCIYNTNSVAYFINIDKFIFRKIDKSTYYKRESKNQFDNFIPKHTPSSDISTSDDRHKGT